MRGGGGGTASAIMAGLAAGIAFVAVFSFVVEGSSMNVLPSSNFSKEPYLEVTLAGIKQKYSAGEPVNFVLEVRRFGASCLADPQIITLKNPSGYEVWRREAAGLLGCGDPDQLTRQEARQVWNSTENLGSPLKVNGTGNYSLVVSYDGGMMERRFKVVPQVVDVVIPLGASASTNGISKNYEPPAIMVFAGYNSTVRWTNHDAVPHGLAADEGSDPGFFSVTQGPGFLEPGESFEYTFAKSGLFRYHGEPGPWLRGLVYVLPPIEKESYVEVSIKGLKARYAAGEPAEFSALVRGYETGCGKVSMAVTRVGGDGAERGVVYSDGLVADCPADVPFHDSELDLPADYSGEDDFSAAFEEPGRYEVVVSYAANLTGASDSATAEFAVG